MFRVFIIDLIKKSEMNILIDTLLEILLLKCTVTFDLLGYSNDSILEIFW